MAEKQETKPQVEEVKATVKSEVSSDSSKDMFAIGSVVLGVLNLCAFCFPFCCLPFSIIGLVLGYLGMKSEKYKTLAIVGMVLCGIGLLLAICGLLSTFVFGWTDNSSWNSFDYNY